ncbi:MAG: DUF6268 family outer membrane beta-barrel protein [Chryseolinea sp.]
MAPSKWITIRHTQAPGRSYRTVNSQEKVYTQEDFYFKMWIPVVHNSKFTAAISPQYRTEQLEFEDNGENSIHMLSHWNLRYAGADLRSIVAVDSSSWLIFNANVNKSGNFGDYKFNSFPLNYTFSAAFLKKKSNNKEIGAGLIVNKSFTGITILPIFVFHYNFSKKAGIEISIPYKVAWRYNASKSDIFYIKAEALNRNYLVRQQSVACSFGRTDIDMGIAYNKSFSKLIGMEAFVAYRQNISNRLPNDVIAIRKSGMAFTLELYIRSPIK